MTGQKPIRITLSRAKGWKMPENTVKVTRPGKWGNPFNFETSDYCWVALSFDCRGDAKGRREASVRAFRDWIAPLHNRHTLSMELQPKFGNNKMDVPIGPKVTAGEAPTMDDIRKNLRGKNLACWCKQPAPGQPDLCHAAVLIELANT